MTTEGGTAQATSEARPAHTFTANAAESCIHRRRVVRGAHAQRPEAAAQRSECRGMGRRDGYVSCASNILICRDLQTCFVPRLESEEEHCFYQTASHESERRQSSCFAQGYCRTVSGEVHPRSRRRSLRGSPEMQDHLRYPCRHRGTCLMALDLIVDYICTTSTFRHGIYSPVDSQYSTCPRPSKSNAISRPLGRPARKRRVIKTSTTTSLPPRDHRTLARQYHPYSQRRHLYGRPCKTNSPQNCRQGEKDRSRWGYVAFTIGGIEGVVGEG